MDGFLAGVDIGGTFTDCVVVSDSGEVITAKAPSSPPNYTEGVVEGLTIAARKIGLTLPELCSRLRLVTHGTTVGTNALVQHRGAKVGLLTTKGHEDVIYIMRGSRGYTGRDIRKVVHYSEGSKPKPIVPRSLIAGISERIDFAGDVIVSLNETELVAAIKHLVAAGVEAIAICFLWSFKNPVHEQRAVELVREHAPDIFVSSSADLVPKWGEYERTTATALNAYIGPITTRYLRNIGERLSELGYKHALQVTQCGGGCISLAKAMEAPLLTLDSGPVSGVTGSSFLGGLMGDGDIITTDMGGTSFDVGMIIGSQAATSHKSIVDQYEYFIPKVEIEAIGAGGGSLARIDELTGSLHVGPESAGSLPGPICYRRGGTIPTVTDADVVLGYFDPDNFADGNMTLDKPAATQAIAALGSKLGLSVDEAAAGITQIAEFHMADLIRRSTVQKGQDPRNFTLYAFGGAGPVHAGVFARELGVTKVIIPQKKTASVWCALGAAAADVLHVFEHVDLMESPFRLERMNRNFAMLRDRGDAQLKREGMRDGTFQYSIDVRHRGQINEIEVPLSSRELSQQDLDRLGPDFFERYEQIYGRGSAFREAKLEVVTFRVRAIASMPKPQLAEDRAGGDTVTTTARRTDRSVYWHTTKERVDTPVYDGSQLASGNTLTGPVLVETSHTTVVVHPGQKLTVDTWGNFVLTFDA